MASRTLRLNMPQWQGGDEPAYRFGAELLRWLAPEHDGPEETVFVPEPNGRAPEIDHGIKARTVLLSQARAARAAIERHDPDRIVTLGGDCLVDLAPMAYLNRKYPALGVLWIDAHPDVMSAAEVFACPCPCAWDVAGPGRRSVHGRSAEKADRLTSNDRRHERLDRRRRRNSEGPGRPACACR